MAARVPELLQICLGSALGILGGKGSVAPLAPAGLAVIGELCHVGHGEEGLRGAQIVVDRALVHGMARDNGKAGLTERLAQRLGESGLVFAPERIGDRFEIFGHVLNLLRSCQCGNAAKTSLWAELRRVQGFPGIVRALSGLSSGCFPVCVRGLIHDLGPVEPETRGRVNASRAALNALPLWGPRC